tara:strand:+ start:939 stop:1256 length:318 start_codon:yes stop_codon:yes gene_type:complete
MAMTLALPTDIWNSRLTEEYSAALAQLEAEAQEDLWYCAWLVEAAEASWPQPIDDDWLKRQIIEKWGSTEMLLVLAGDGTAADLERVLNSRYLRVMLQTCVRDIR